MRKDLLLALAGVFASIAPTLAYPPAANVNFSSERGVPFGLVLDGRPLTRGLARQVHIDQLVPGLHWADFTVPTAYGGAVRFRSRVWLEPGLETSFVLIARPGRPLTLRRVNAMVLYGPNPGCEDGYRDNGHGSRYNQPVPYNQPQPSSNYPYDGDANNGYDGNAAPRSNSSSGDDYNSNSNNGRGRYGNAPSSSDYSGSAGNNFRSMRPQDVDALVQAVQQRPFEASKLGMAKDALRQNSIQADDLKRLLRTLKVEASRVELAKFAYPHVADQQNFYRVYDAFEFEASVQEVQQAVASASPR